MISKLYIPIFVFADSSFFLEICFFPSFILSSKYFFSNFPAPFLNILCMFMGFVLLSIFSVFHFAFHSLLGFLFSPTVYLIIFYECCVLFLLRTFKLLVVLFRLQYLWLLLSSRLRCAPQPFVILLTSNRSLKWTRYLSMIFFH